MSDKIHIIFDGPPDHESGRFIEVENDDHASIKVGEWRAVMPSANSDHDILAPLWELVIDPLTLVMQCERHQGVVWPHDDCAGPGMPIRTSLIEGTPE